MIAGVVIAIALIALAIVGVYTVYSMRKAAREAEMTRWAVESQDANIEVSSRAFGPSAEPNRGTFEDNPMGSARSNYA